MDDFAVIARFLLAEYFSRTTLLTDWFVTPYEERFSNWDIIEEASKKSAAAEKVKVEMDELGFQFDESIARWHNNFDNYIGYSTKISAQCE